jgi:hypothetical protein
MSKYVTDHAELVKLIASIKTRGVKLDNDIQAVGLSAINAVAEHGNVFYINSLYQAMGKGARHAALTAWLCAFGGVAANTAKDKASKPFVFSKDKSVDLVSATAKPWHSFKPSPEPDAVFDVYAALMGVLKKTQKDGVELKHGELVTGMRELLSSIDPDAVDGIKGEEQGADEDQGGTVRVLDTITA